MIDPEDRLPRQKEYVLGSQMSYATVGSGPTLVFMHGIASYSYEWRNIIPFLASTYRCVAVDLYGFGDSGRVSPSGPGSYRFGDVRTHFSVFLEIMKIRPRLIVGRDLGALVALNIAQANPDIVDGLVLIEPMVRRANITSWPIEHQKLFGRLTSPGSEKVALAEEGIIRDWVQATTLRQLGQIELDNYRRPYAVDTERGRAMHTFLSALPVEGRSGPLDAVIDEAWVWGSKSPIPKLVVGGDPGLLSPPDALEGISEWNGTTVASVSGISNLCEDSPSRLVAHIASFASAL